MSQISSYVKLSPKETVIDNWEVVNDRGTPTVAEIVAAVVLGVACYFLIHFITNLLFSTRPMQELLFHREYIPSAEEERISDELLNLRYGYSRSIDDARGPQPPENEVDKAQRIRDLEAKRDALRAANRPAGAGWVYSLRDLLALGLTFMLFGWPLLTRPALNGSIYLTNWRLLYFAYGQNRFRSLFDLQTVNLADVLGVHSFYSEGTFGKKQLRIVIHTRFHDGLQIAAGNTGSALAKLPLVGRWLNRILIRDTLGKDAFVLLPVLYGRIRQNAGAVATTGVSY